MASKNLTTYGDLLALRNRLIHVRDNQKASEGLGKVFNAQLEESKDYEIALLRISCETFIAYEDLDEYYEWFYGGEPAEHAYLFISSKKGKDIDFRVDSEGLPHGIRIIGFFDRDGGYFSGYIPDELRGETLLFAVQQMLDALRILTVTAEEIVNFKSITY